MTYINTKINQSSRNCARCDPRYPEIVAAHRLDGPGGDFGELVGIGVNTRPGRDDRRPMTC
ncbi:hypothetical protein EMIT0373P_11130 [Pseudomonas chlororaphis]